MPLNCGSHYWKGMVPTNKVFYEIPVETNEKKNFPEQNDYILDKKRRSSNVENMDINSLSQFSSPSTSAISSQKEPLFKKNKSRISLVNGGDSSFNQPSGFESLLQPTSMQAPTGSALSPKKKKRQRTFLPRETTQSKKKFIKLQDNVKRTQKNISNAKKQRAHMNPVKTAPDLISTKNNNFQQSTCTERISHKIQSEVLKPQEKFGKKIQQLTGVSEMSSKIKAKVSNAIPGKKQQLAKGLKKAKNEEMVSPSLVQNDPFHCTTPLDRTSTKNDFQQPAYTEGMSKKIQKSEMLKPREKFGEKIQQLPEVNLKTSKRKLKVSNAISVKQQCLTKSPKIENMVSPSSMQNDSSDCTAKSQPTNNLSKQEVCSKTKMVKVPNASSVKKKSIVSERKKSKKYNRINPMETSDSESDEELCQKKKLKSKKPPKPIDSESESDEEKTEVCIKENTPVSEVESIPVVVPIALPTQEMTNSLCSTTKELKSSEPISSSEVDAEKNVKSQPIPSEVDLVVIDDEEEDICEEENISTLCSRNPVQSTSKNPYKNSEDPFHDKYQPAYYTDIVQQVKGSAESITDQMASTSKIESGETVDLDVLEIIDVSSDEDDVIFIGANTANNGSDEISKE